MNICVITDNIYIFESFLELTKGRQENFNFFYSSCNKTFAEKFKDSEMFKPIRLKDMDDSFFTKYCLFISLHCKQLFPDNMTTRHRCINVHAGYNPFNRGWFSQVFSIINKYPIGVTIHEMDSELDHGPIIYQKRLDIEEYETSYDVYQRILAAEIELLEEHLTDIISHNYETHMMEHEGNINYKKDFDELCKLDLNKVGTLGSFLDYLRAVTFQTYDNAYFYDKNGNKIFVSVNLKKK